MQALFATAERTKDYSLADNYVYQRHVFAYQHAARLLGNVVIELGCGNGYGMQLLAPHCQWYTGVDKYAAARTLSANSGFFKASLPNLNNIGSNSFDTVICFQVLEHIKQDAQLLAEIHRILKPGGQLLLTTPNKLMSLTRNPFHVREYTPQGMEQLTASAFSKYAIRGIKGNSSVMDYYNCNKKQVARITRWDVLNLQQRLPAFMLKLPYNMMNNLSRFALYNRQSALTATIEYSDFYLDEADEYSLDFFVVAEKE